ncbi:hypothetical protein [Providencia phage Kokobel2]|nr:hypothetical protein [Providencia phage Kokobel2]
MKNKSTEVVEAKGFNVADFSADVPDFLKDKIDDDRGNEGVGSEDMTVPRLELVQSLSAVRKKNDPAYIEGIQEGDLYNNITREIYGQEVFFVPVAFKKEYLLWRDQKLGGGFGGAFEDSQEAAAVKMGQEKPEEWEVVDTNQHFGLLISPESGQIIEAVVSMAKSKAKVSRHFNSLVRLNGGARFSRIYRIRGIQDQNQQGQDFYNIAIDNIGYVNEDLYKRAESFYELLQSGKVTADRSYEEATSSDDAQQEHSEF